jgi:hypothetical protein
MEPVSAPSPLWNSLNSKASRRRPRSGLTCRLTLETTIVPRPPYSLAMSAGKSDATRHFRDGVLTLALDAGDTRALLAP